MLRLTTTHFPSHDTIADASGLPFGTLVSPLAPSPGPPPKPNPASDDVSSSTVPDPTEDQIDEFIRSSAPESTFLPRCYRCAGYISLHCQLASRVWRCTLCGAQNTLPSRYLPVVRAGPHAISYVPELSRTTYDVPVADDVPVTPLAYVFIVDVNGDDAYLDSVRVAVRKALDVVDGQTLSGLILYGDDVSFLDARANGSGGVLRKDVNEFSTEQWLRPTGKKFTDVVMEAMGKLSGGRGFIGGGMQQREPRRAMGKAVKLALDMIEQAALTGTRFVILAGGEPNFGEGALGLKGRPIDGPIGVESDKIPSPSTSFYSEQGMRASLLGVMIDMYVTSCKPVDVASLAPLVQINGGRLLLYDGNNSGSSGSGGTMGIGSNTSGGSSGGVGGMMSTLAQDVWQHLNDPTVLRGLMRVRTSPELSTIEVYGSGLFRDATVEDVFRLNCHGHSSTLAVEFRVNPKPKRGFFSPVEPKNSKKQLCIQIAFRGVFIEPGMMPQRVLRVETVMVDASASPRTTWDFADANAIASVMFQKAIAIADDQGIGAARVLLFDWLGHLVKCGDVYQKRRQRLQQKKKQAEKAQSESDARTNGNVGRQDETTKLVGEENVHVAMDKLDIGKDTDTNGTMKESRKKEEDDTQTWMDDYDSLRTMPQLIFGLIRSFMFRQEAVAPDIRSATRCLWEDLCPELLSAAIYPKLVSFVNLGDSDAKPVEPSDAIGWSLPLSLEAVKDCGHGIFLIDAFSEIVIYYTTEGSQLYAYPPPETSVVVKVKAQCLRDRPLSPRVIICRQGTADERWFTSYLMEDGAAPGTATNSTQSYSQFMQGIKDAATLV